jgi:hypothetical protein
MEQWAEVRRRVLVDGLSKRKACQQFGINWKTLQKMLTYPEPRSVKDVPAGWWATSSASSVRMAAASGSDSARILSRFPTGPPGRPGQVWDAGPIVSADNGPDAVAGRVNDPFAFALGRDGRLDERDDAGQVFPKRVRIQGDDPDPLRAEHLGRARTVPVVPDHPDE